MSHHGGHGYPKTKAIRQFNRSEAEKRQAEYDKLTLQEKIDRLPPEPHAKKQRAKLLALLNKPVKTPEVEAAPIVPDPTAGMKGRAKRLQKMIDSTVAGETQPSSFRELTDRAANEARNESKKGSK